MTPEEAELQARGHALVASTEVYARAHPEFIEALRQAETELMRMSVRPEVAWFAEQMELQLKANDHKGGWSNLDMDYFFRRLDEELDELSVASVLVEQDATDEVVAGVIREAADVANFALMIADVARQRYAERTASPSA